MKERLNLTIDGALLEAMKVYAAGKGISVSELVEGYFRQVTRPVLRHNILDMVDQLEGPVGAENGISGSSMDGRRGGLAAKDREVINGV